MTDTPTPHITQEAAREMLAALREIVALTGAACLHQTSLDKAGLVEYAEEALSVARVAIALATGGEARS